MNYFIHGGEFNNKGAEAMILVALKNIYANDENANVFVTTKETKVPFEFKGKVTFIQTKSFFFESLIHKNQISTLKRIFKECIKLFVPWKSSLFFEYFKVKAILKKIDFMIDISGFALSSKWGETYSIQYVDCVDAMSQCGAKVYLMPQSFGPFDFSEETKIYISDRLKKCELIFAREKNGYKELISMGLTNVVLAYDSVLTEKCFDANLIIKDVDKYKEDIELVGIHNVGIIPNYRLFDRGSVDRTKVISMYTKIINKGIHEGICFYLIAHAGEDIEICNEIKSYFKEENRVVCLNHVLYSFNYENFSKNMDFIIASRYHSIVHAYKEGTPAIIIGWSDKYDSIAAAFGQEKYIIDTDNLDKGIETFDLMNKFYEFERNSINKRLDNIQANSCYSFLNTPESLFAKKER
jgi:colanic acid/amylovoran biosynthesis protein